jgi:nucleotide-binding universal stress UspA family protein
MAEVANEPERIMVGVDGSEESRHALRWAADKARRLGASLQVVHALWEPHSVPHGPSIPTMVRELQSFAGRPQHVIDESLAEIADSHVPVRSEVISGSPAAVLIDAARGAEMLVVGSRGHGGFAGLLLGSVSQQCAAHAPCPVVVVPRNRVRTEAKGASVGDIEHSIHRT